MYRTRTKESKSDRALHLMMNQKPVGEWRKFIKIRDKIVLTRLTVLYEIDLKIKLF